MGAGGALTGRAHRITVTGRADVRVAWERYADPRRWPGWAPQIRRVDYGPDRLTPGTAGVVHGPLGLRVPFTVLEVTPPAWVWAVRVAGVRVVMRHDLEAMTDGTRAVLLVSAPALLARLYSPVARIALARLVRP